MSDAWHLSLLLTLAWGMTGYVLALGAGTGATQVARCLLVATGMIGAFLLFTAGLLASRILL